jgi:hypothetical protein
MDTDVDHMDVQIPIRRGLPCLEWRYIILTGSRTCRSPISALFRDKTASAKCERMR